MEATIHLRSKRKDENSFLTSPLIGLIETRYATAIGSVMIYARHV